jgi:hypothetical protein
MALSATRIRWIVESVEPAARRRHPRRLGRADQPPGIVRRSLAFASPRAACFGFGRRSGRPRNRRVSCMCRPHHPSLGSIGADRVLLRAGLHRTREPRVRRSHLIGRSRVRRGARSSGHQPPFLEVPPMELGREAIRAPLGRPLLCVSQQGSLGELLLGQHRLVIGRRTARTSVRAGGRVAPSPLNRSCGEPPLRAR